MSAGRRSSQAVRYSIHTWNSGMRDDLPHRIQERARFVAASCQAQPDHPDAIVASGNQPRNLDRQQPVDVADHEQRLVEAGRHIGIEPARFGVSRERFVVQPAVAARVDQAGEELGIISVSTGFARAGAPSRARPCRYRPRDARRTCARSTVEGSVRARAAETLRRESRCREMPRRTSR